ncbi:MAG: hypothetical protein ACUVV4_05785 [Candidatus Bathyarchaeia archaeon]
MHQTEDLKKELFEISGEQIKESEKELEKKDYTTIQKFLLRMLGRIRVGMKKEPEWGSPLPIYAFICPKHGIQTAYPNGWNKTLYCPKCISEVSNQLSVRYKTKNASTGKAP